MTTNSTVGKLFIPKWYCYLLLTAAVMTYLLITLGGIVCVTESGLGCPDWPGCYGQIVPPPRLDAIIEYMHRFTAALTSPFIIAAAIIGWWKFRSVWWVSRPPLMAVALLLAVIAFGATAVLRGLRPEIAAIDLGSALMVLALMLIATVAAFARYQQPTLPDQLLFRSAFARLTLWALVAVFVVLVSGVLVADSGSLARCLGWPLYNERLAPSDFHDWLHLARYSLAGIATLLILAAIVQAWRTPHQPTMLLRAAMGVGIVFLVEAIVGALMLLYGLTVLLLVIYVAAAAALWFLLVVLVVLAGLTDPLSTFERFPLEASRLQE